WLMQVHRIVVDAMNSQREPSSVGKVESEGPGSDDEEGEGESRETGRERGMWGAEDADARLLRDISTQLQPVIVVVDGADIALSTRADDDGGDGDGEGEGEGGAGGMGG